MKLDDIRAEYAEEKRNEEAKTKTEEATRAENDKQQTMDALVGSIKSQVSATRNRKLQQLIIATKSAKRNVKTAYEKFAPYALECQSNLQAKLDSFLGSSSVKVTCDHNDFTLQKVRVAATTNARYVSMLLDCF